MKFKLLGLLILLISLADCLYAGVAADTPRYDIVKLEIKRLKRQRTLHIYFPPSYWNTRKKFPVIYVQDGQTTFIKDAYNNNESWYADSLVNLMPTNKQCIIVAIQSGINSVRMQEYNPYTGTSDAAIYAAYVAKDVKTYIDTTFRTLQDAKHTAVVGSSMGGLISMYIAAKYSDIFGVAGIFSPAFWYAEPVYDDMTKQAINPKSKFFFAYGDDEGNEADYVNRMVTLLNNKKIGPKNIPAPLVTKGKHDEKQWRLDFEAFYRWFSNQF
ncbi:alpha/beta hydrolase-fold protein [Mucilaginibacter sp. dw_454]|uniref:alpha/beta hydrolase n=1 Tax=Mucilaginibacter sp. dw_454 TaxID=2720079 RepID=UPI001BD6D319|nr:alpha/beta hydrolase-fold protein [Mucilaginibacter sp. dw_454]